MLLNFKIAFVIGLLLWFSITYSQAQKAAYQLFTANGKATTYQKLLKKAQGAQIVCFGELHNNPIAHWLQYELIKDLHENKHTLQVGMEMLERHQQPAIDAYWSKQLTTKQFEDTLKLWPNYSTDYKPIVEFCRANNLNLYATNIPRTLASKVFKQGLSALENESPETKAQMVPLPFAIDYNLPSYQKMTKMLGDHSQDPEQAKRFIAAQAIKDATMAHFTLQNLKPNTIFIHLNGAFHTDYQEGIIWYLKQNNNNLKILNISTVEQNNLKQLQKEHLNKADFIIAVPSSMTKTY